MSLALSVLEDKNIVFLALVVALVLRKNSWPWSKNLASSYSLQILVDELTVTQTRRVKYIFYQESIF